MSVCIIKHKEIDDNDIVEYQGSEYIVLCVWNHGMMEWWFDLKAVNPILPKVNYYKEELSVPEHEIKLLRKHKQEKEA